LTSQSIGGTRPFLFGLALGCAAIVAAPAAQAPDTTVYTATYVEVAPASERATISLLKEYGEASRAEKGHVSLDLLQQIDRPGHFVLLEAWTDQLAYDAHGTAAAAKMLVEKLQPIRVSPIDERPYKGLSVVSKAGDPTRQAVYVVTHVDTIPAPGSNSPDLLKRLADESRKDDGNLRFDLWQQTLRANHLTVVEVWRDPKALYAHTAALHTRQYRETLQPLAGSPLDERVFKSIE
jgi:quinol monooxygenase YgiN